MAKLPPPPPVHELAALAPQALRLAKGSWLARIGFAAGGHPTAWNQFRHWGPGASRFDHHLPDKHGQPHTQRRGVLYAAGAAPTCIAEVFQATRLVDVHQDQPWLAIWRTTAPLLLLDLTGAFVTRMGASTAIHSEAESQSGVPEQVAKTCPIEAQSAAIAPAMASICNDERARFGGMSGHDRLALSLSSPRARARQWAAALYQAFPLFDGIAYCSSMNGNAPAFVFNERTLRKRPFPKRPEYLRMLADPLTADLIDAAADALGYMVKR